MHRPAPSLSPFRFTTLRRQVLAGSRTGPGPEVGRRCSCIVIRTICRIAERQLCGSNSTPHEQPNSPHHWVSRDSKSRFAAVAKAQGLSESALLRRLVESALAALDGTGSKMPEPVDPIASSGRISVRLRSDDLLLLRERARAREIPTSTYVSFLVRVHLRAQTVARRSGWVARQSGWRRLSRRGDSAAVGCRWQ
jgi:hypothetical protein